MSSVSVIAGGSLSFFGRRRRPVTGIRASGLAAPPILTDLHAKCATPLPVLRRVADAMAAEMKAGLISDGAGGLPMIPTFVESLPSGYSTSHVCLFLI